MLQRVVTELMDQHRLDALVFPFKTLPATKISEGWNNREADNPLSSQTGFPGLLVPAGFTREGLPIALEFLGRPFSEPVLFRLASAYEHTSGHRKTPPFTPPLSGEVIEY
jgi:Asp-tRNA(Asn)/Glu-tRNA(Gln) amidotransferase A subunit family amidase